MFHSHTGDRCELAPILETPNPAILVGTLDRDRSGAESQALIDRIGACPSGRS
jgi:hypothetical protein